MRAAVLAGEGTHSTFALCDSPRPEPGAGDALVRVLRSGICGSDVHFVHDSWDATAFRPIVLGHEAVGVVEAFGPDADHAAGSAGVGPAVGTRVSIHPVFACTTCDRCV